MKMILNLNQNNINKIGFVIINGKIKMIIPKLEPRIKEYLKNKNISQIFYDIYPKFDYYFNSYSIMKNDSETECSHIFPVNYFSKWLSEDQKKEIRKNKNKKTRDQKIKVLINEEEKKVTLHNLASANNIFPDELEKMLNYLYKEDKKIFTDKLEKLDKIIKLRDDDILEEDFFIAFDYGEQKIFNNLKFNEKKEIHEEYKNKILNELKEINESEIVIYFSFLKAKKDFYNLCESELSETVVNVINQMLKNKPKFINSINYIFKKFILMCFLIKFYHEFDEYNNRENEYLSYYLGLKEYIFYNYELNVKKDEKLIIKFLKKLKENIKYQKLDNSYLYANINEHFIYDTYNFYEKKDRNLSYLIFNTKTKLITSEIPIIKKNYENLGFNNFEKLLNNINIKVENDTIWFNSYSSNILIISANEYFLNFICFLPEEEKGIFIEYINCLIEKESKNNNLMLIK